MNRAPHIEMLPDGKRLHLQDGPIDLIVQAFGSPNTVAEAYRIAARRLSGLLDVLCEELVALRQQIDPRAVPNGIVARRMHAATLPFAAEMFITPMAAVAGSVADDILAAIQAKVDLDRLYVNNGGDIALYCGLGQHFTIGMIDRPDQPSLFGRLTLKGEDEIGGVATSGWRGRSFSRGIADSVTVLAQDAASADAAATVIANAVDLPGHPAVHRAPATSIQSDSDLGSRLVTRRVDRLDDGDRATALRCGIAQAENLVGRGLIMAAALHLQGETRVVAPRTQDRFALIPPPAPITEARAHA
ncbi:UPF0280 family protein [Beijerinckia sp. L45]|uniref:UPF0280 family protein n=1 Tax=Beijerinckia sp. L45 TaxID=1641855 RepID=UPI00131BE712|nr:UPF0280 family protein [Beijerinckia sp. L45]